MPNYTIHRTDDGAFVVAADGVWLPGYYKSQEAAEFAPSLAEDTLNELNNRICNIGGENRPLTLEDLRRPIG